jgi:AraC-like DNA-binding protein
MPKPCNTAEIPVGAPELTCWSTDDVDKTQRIDYYEETVARSMIPVGIRMRCASDFSSSMKMTSVDGFSVLRIKGSPHEVYRAEREIARSGAHKYHLLLTCETPWTLHHQGAVALEAGEAVLLDSQRPQTSTTTVPYEMVHVMLDAAWLDQWVPQPDMLVGRKITAATPWGNSLASFAKVLTPELLLDSPLPARLLSDHLGAMLALACNEMDQKVAPRKSETSQRHRILDMLAQQCTDPQLTAKDVAASLNVSVRTLHRALALTKETFGPLLIEARLRIARRMLESRIFMNMTVSEIAKRTGFATSSHFARVFHSVYGMTPSGFRQTSLGETGHEISPPDSSFDSPAVSSPRPVEKRG